MRPVEVHAWRRVGARVVRVVEMHTVDIGQERSDHLPGEVASFLSGARPTLVRGRFLCPAEVIDQVDLGQDSAG